MPEQETYDELMARRAELTRFWMETVLPPLKARYSEPTDGLTFGVGPVLSKRGVLTIMFWEDGQRAFDVVSERGKPIRVVPAL